MRRSLGALAILAGLLASASLPPRQMKAVFAAPLIANLVVNDAANAADWSVRNGLAPGDQQYGDRAFLFTSVPAGVAGLEWVRTANDSKAFTGATLVTFTVTADADVFVAHNDSITTKPAWLSAAAGWTDTGMNLVNNESTPRTFSLFRKSFPAGGTVSLGNNGSTSAGMYAVLAKPSAPPPPGLIANLSVNDGANAADWSVRENLAQGNAQYGDRAFTLSSVPSSVAGSAWIRTANDSKAFTGATLATFTVTADADVLVAFNDSITTRPAWLSSANGWTDTGDDLVNNESTPKTFSLLRKAFPAGATVALGNNGSTSAGMYTVVAKAPGPPPGDDIVLDSDQLSLRASLSPYRYQVIERSSGQVLVSHSLTTLTLGGTARTVTSARDASTTATTADATLVLGGTTTTGHVRFAFSSPDVLEVLVTSNSGTPSNVTEEFNDQGEHYYGIWEYHVGGGVDNRGQERDLLGFGRLADTNFCSARAPFYVTSRKYGIYTESVRQARYAVAVGGKTRASFNDSRLRYHVLYGPSYARIFEHYNRIAGPSFMPPLWAFDSIWWRDDNHNDHDENNVDNSQELVIKDADQLRANRIPASAIWIDRPYGTGTQGWGNLDFDSSFPNPAGMVSSLRSRGMNLLLWTTNRAANRLRTEGEDLGYLFDPAQFTSWPAADLRIPAAYDWFKDHLDTFVSLGVRGYKIDRGEEGEMPNSVQNEMVTLFAKLSKEGQDARHPGDNLIFARNVHDKGRQYVAVWNGDTKVDFPALAGSIRNALRAGAINMPMWGSDIGGYNGGTLTKELFARWFQFGAWSTMMETKIGPGPRTPWNHFDAELVGIARTQATTHHDLIPYTRSSLNEAVRTGMPAMRQLLFDYPSDTSLFNRGDEYLFGKYILVAPVTTDGARTRSVYLPAGRWMNYNDRTTLHTGPTTVTASAPLGTIPLYVKAGAIVPRGDILRANNNWVPNWAPSLRIEFFPAAGVDGSFDYFTGSALRPITSVLSDTTLTIEFGDLGVNGKLEIYCDAPTTVVRNGVTLTPGTDYTYDGARRLLTVPYTGATTLTVNGTGSVF
jgi:alpha-D-xyloside xylohydrolase